LQLICCTLLSSLSSLQTQVIPMSQAPAEAAIMPQQEIVLAALDHAGDGASACDQALPRLSTFAAMQGLWRPTLGGGEKGYMVVIPQQPGQLTTVCGIAIDQSKTPSGLLFTHSLPAGTYAESVVHGDWACIEQAAVALLGSAIGALGMVAKGPWICLFRTNPRSTAPQDWESSIRVAITPQE
jgi:hypothetical protein